METLKAAAPTAIVFFLSCLRIATAAESACKEELTRLIPVRPGNAPTGTDFVAQVSSRNDDERESALLSTLLAGNMPPFLRQLKPVHLQARVPDGQLEDVTVCVLPDYLAVGSDQNFFL